MSDFEDFFQENASGPFAPSFKFGKIGAGVKGTIVSIRRGVVTQMGSKEPKLDKNGNEQPQLNVVLQTTLRDWKNVYKVPTDEDDNELDADEDDGTRAVYIKHRMISAVADALRSAGVKSVAEGGVLAIKKTGEIPTAYANGIPEFEARYTAPAEEENADLFEEDDDETPPPAKGKAKGKAKSKPKAAVVEDDDDDSEPPF